MLSDMTTCAYCNRPATATIIANPSRVCAEHAREFWTGLLSYTRGRSEVCLKGEMPCTPGDHVDFAIQLAS
jgi:hypothetical protein